MTEENHVEELDESLLLVSGNKGDKSRNKDYVKKLSNAILKVYYKHDEVKSRCVGAASFEVGFTDALLIKTGVLGILISCLTST